MLAYQGHSVSLVTLKMFDFRFIGWVRSEHFGAVFVDLAQHTLQLLWYHLISSLVKDGLLRLSASTESAFQQSRSTDFPFHSYLRPPPCLIVLQWSTAAMRFSGTQTETQDQPQKKVTKKQTECILFLGPAAMLSHSQVSESTLTCFFLCVRVPDGWPDIIFDSLRVVDCSVRTQCNVIPALLFVLLMYLESPPPVGQQFFYFF